VSSGTVPQNPGSRTLVGRDVNEAKTLARPVVRLREMGCVASRSEKRAHHVRAHERVGAVDGSIDMRLRGEVDDRIGRVLAE